MAKIVETIGTRSSRSEDIRSRAAARKERAETVQRQGYPDYGQLSAAEREQLANTKSPLPLATSVERQPWYPPAVQTIAREAFLLGAALKNAATLDLLHPDDFQNADLRHALESAKRIRSGTANPTDALTLHTNAGLVTGTDVMIPEEVGIKAGIVEQVARRGKEATAAKRLREELRKAATTTHGDASDRELLARWNSNRSS